MLRQALDRFCAVGFWELEGNQVRGGCYSHEWGAGWVLQPPVGTWVGATATSGGFWELVGNQVRGGCYSHQSGPGSVLQPPVGTMVDATATSGEVLGAGGKPGAG